MIRASDLTGWGNGGGWDADPDLDGVDPDWEVTIEMLNVPPYAEKEYVADTTLMLSYVAMYRERGPWALPPVIVTRDRRSTIGDMLITGNHRLAAAGVAKLPQLPCLVIHVPTDD